MEDAYPSGDGAGVTQPGSGSSKQAAAPSRSEPQAIGLLPHGRRIRVQLREADAGALHRQRAAAGMSAACYVATLLAAVEEGRAQIAGKDAVEALAQSNYQLSWLGRNLRELLRKLEASAPQQGADTNALKLLQDTIGLLTKHLARASAVLADIETTRCFGRQRAVHASSSPRSKR